MLATGANDGSSWADAYVRLQDALAAAHGGDTVYVAAGVYYPDEGVGQSNNDRASSFTVRGGVDLEGGYPRGGGARDIAANPTILSGDLQQNDVNLDGNAISEDPEHVVGGNAFSVVTIDGTGRTSVSGLIITGGLADDESTDASGAGIRAVGSVSNRINLVVSQCLFTGCVARSSTPDSNYSASGAAIFIANGDLQMSATTLSQNLTEDQQFILSGGTVRIDGAVQSVEVSSRFFDQNSAAAIETFSASGVELYVDTDLSNATCVVSDTTFSGHRDPDEYNGLARFGGLDSLRIERNRWINNRCRVLISIHDCASSTIESSVLSGNEAETLIQLNNDVALSILNSTIVGNEADQTFRRVNLSSTIGSISIGNSFIDTRIGPNVEPQVMVFRSHSIVEGFDADGSGNLDEDIDPGFVDPRSSDFAPTAAGDYRLAPDSPLIDAGLNASNPAATLDLDRNARVRDGNGDGSADIDIGAYEFDRPAARITAVVLNPANGRITLTVESITDTTFTTQSNPDLREGTWENETSGSLAIGMNTVNIEGNAYGWPVAEYFFRVVTP